MAARFASLPQQIILSQDCLSGIRVSKEQIECRTTGKVWQLADMRSLCEPKIEVRVAFANVARVIFATRVLALYIG
jgi:hypothetical protein